MPAPGVKWVNTASSFALKVSAAVLCAAHGAKCPINNNVATAGVPYRSRSDVSLKVAVFNQQSLALGLEWPPNNERKRHRPRAQRHPHPYSNALSQYRHLRTPRTACRGETCRPHTLQRVRRI